MQPVSDVPISPFRTTEMSASTMEATPTLQTQESFISQKCQAEQKPKSTSNFIEIANSNKTSLQ